MPTSVEQLISFKNVTVGGRECTIFRMKPLTVIAVARRLAPLLGILKNMRDGASAPVDAGPPATGSTPGTPAAEQNFANAMERFGPLLEGLARLPEADVHYVIGACLSCVHARGSAFPRAWSAEMDSLSDESFSPGDVMSLTGQVLFKVFEELMGDLPDIGLMSAKAG